MAVTLNDHVKVADNEGRYLVAEIGDYFLMNSNVLQILPWATSVELAVQIPFLSALASTTWRKINASFSGTQSNFDSKIESKYIAGNYIDVDIVLVTANPRMRTLQREAITKSIAFEFNDQFINGDPANDEFKGVYSRIDDIYADGYTDQYFDAGSSTTGRGMLYDTTERHYFFDQVNKLIYVIEGHDPDGLYMNSKLYLAFESAARRENLLKQTEDMYGRVINTYGSKNTPLIDIGLKADQSTLIMPNSETLSGGTDETSIVAAKYGVDTHLWGIQQAPLDVFDHGRISSSPVYRDEVTWVVGLAISNPRAVARAYGFVADSGAS